MGDQDTQTPKEQESREFEAFQVWTHKNWEFFLYVAGALMGLAMGFIAMAAHLSRDPTFLIMGAAGGLLGAQIWGISAPLFFGGLIISVVLSFKDPQGWWVTSVVIHK